MIEVPIQEESNNEDVLAFVAKKLCEITEKHADIFRAGYDAGLLGAKTLSLFETYRAEAMKEAKAYTDKQINSIMGEGASETLDTIGEIAQVLGDENVVNRIFFELYNHTHYADYPSIDEFNNLAGDYQTHNHDSEYARQGHEHPEYASDNEFKELAYNFDNHTHDEFNDITTHTYAIADLQVTVNEVEEAVATHTTDIYKNTQAIANLQKNALYIKQLTITHTVEGAYTQQSGGKYTKTDTLTVDGVVLGVSVLASTEGGSADVVDVESSVLYPQYTSSTHSLIHAQTTITATGYVGLSTAGDMDFTYTVLYIGI